MLLNRSLVIKGMNNQRTQWSTWEVSITGSLFLHTQYRRLCLFLETRVRGRAESQSYGGSSGMARIMETQQPRWTEGERTTLPRSSFQPLIPLQVPHTAEPSKTAADMWPWTQVSAPQSRAGKGQERAVRAHTPRTIEKRWWWWWQWFLLFLQ